MNLNVVSNIEYDDGLRHSCGVEIRNEGIIYNFYFQSMGVDSVIALEDDIVIYSPNAQYWYYKPGCMPLREEYQMFPSEHAEYNDDWNLCSE